MKIRVHKHFEKQYKKLRLNEKKKFQERSEIFLSNPSNRLLNSHPLHGRFGGYRSINITGDLRVVYRMIAIDVAYFVAIGRHRDLYD